METTVLNQSALSCQHFPGNVAFSRFRDGFGSAAVLRRFKKHSEIENRCFTVCA
jgi:hypothetical protein